MEELMSGPVAAYLGLGSNMGDRKACLTKAMERLSDTPSLTLKRSSSIYETDPWGYIEQPDFLNCVLEVETRLSPVSLLMRAKEVEMEVGRQPGRRYGPRLIDVDILLYGDQTLQFADPDLQIPHPRMNQRAFVLVPLAELNENLMHPTSQATIADLIREVDDQDSVRVWGPPLLSGR